MRFHRTSTYCSEQLENINWAFCLFHNATDNNIAKMHTCVLYAVLHFYRT